MGDVKRVWGQYNVLKECIGYKIKTLTVSVGKSLSNQRHQHRSEHWTIVSGTAFVETDTGRRFIAPNNSIYIPKNSWHRLENKGKIPLVIVEVQCGEYLEEDDIERQPFSEKVKNKEKEI